MNNIVFRLITFMFLLSPVLCVGVFPDRAECDEILTALEGEVPVVKLTELYWGRMRFHISRNVEVFYLREDGKKMTIKELAILGRIDKARLFLKGGTVVKIVVLNMRQ